MNKKIIVHAWQPTKTWETCCAATPPDIAKMRQDRHPFLRPLALALMLCATQASHGQVVQTSMDRADIVVSPYRVAASGPHERVWQKLTVDSQGFTNTHAFTELATGLNFWNPATARWEPTIQAFQILQNGYAIATNGPHKAVIAPDIATSPAIDMLGHDGHRLASDPRALVFRDPASGNTAVIASVTNCVGQLVDSNIIAFPSAFDSVRAALSYTYKRSGLEQDVIFYQQLPSPASFGFDPATSVLEIWTEFLVAPSPTATASPVTDDPILRFGQTKMGHGLAYLQDSQGRSASIRLQKSWETINGRNFLVESVRYTAIKPLLDKLQARVPTPKKSETAKVIYPDRERLAKEVFQPRAKPTEMASIHPGVMSREPAVVADYQTLNSSLSNYTFAASTTYFVSGGVEIDGVTTFENAVIKYTNDYWNAYLYLDTVVCNTDPYRMAIFTSQNDNSVGEVVTGSSGTPATPEGALHVIVENGGVFKNMRFSYASVGIYGTVDKVHNSSVWNCQFLNCDQAILSLGGGADLHNVLFSHCNEGVYDFFGAADTFRGEHITADAIGRLYDSYSSAGALTNSILTAVTNKGLSILDHCATNSSSAGFYQSAGAGNYYLVNGSTNRNAGTTNISAAQLSDLKKKTTYPPIVYSNVTWSSNMTLGVQAQRNTGLPDRGFAYAPIDYITHLVYVTNCSLTLAPGVAIACYNWTGIALQEGSSINCIGTPLAPIWLIGYQCVQEQPLGLGGSTASWSVNPYHTGTPSPTGTFRFSRFVCSPGGGNQFSDGSWSFGNLLARDCEFWGGVSKLDGAANTSQTIVNNLFYRGTCQSPATLTNSLSVSNNLFTFVTSLELKPVNAALWSVYNNLFDSCTFFVIPGTITGSGNNAYRNCNKQLNPTNSSDITLTNAIVYQTGALSSFYQPTNSPLIDKGSCSASAAGLYHYCTTTNQVKDASSTVDIGLHLIALDGSGAVADFDHDGLADYLEDANGDGVFNAGDIANWTLADTDYDGVNDGKEVADGTNPQDPNSVKQYTLGYWRFNNTNTWVGEQGQLPCWCTNVQGIPSFSTNAVCVGGANCSGLAYREVESGGAANINLRSGSLRFWIKPLWTSSSLGGTGPGSAARLIELGNYSAPATNGWWSLFTDSGGDNLSFATATNGSAVTNFTVPISWISNQWRLLVLTYCPTNTQIYENLNSIGTGSGVSAFPNASERSSGFRVGSDASGSNKVQAAVDDLQTFNYPLPSPDYVGVPPGCLPIIWGPWHIPDGPLMNFKFSFPDTTIPGETVRIAVTNLFPGVLAEQDGVDLCGLTTVSQFTPVLIDSTSLDWFVDIPSTNSTGTITHSFGLGAASFTVPDEIDFVPARTGPMYYFASYHIAAPVPVLGSPIQSALVPFTVVPKGRLARFTFDSSSLVGDGGQLPLSGGAIQSNPPQVGSAFGKGVDFETSNKLLKYSNFQSDRAVLSVQGFDPVYSSGTPNIRRSKGTIRFWFKPSWAKGGGPANGILLQMPGWNWTLKLSGDATALELYLKAAYLNSTPTLTYALDPTEWSSSHQWHQIAVTYDDTSAALYIDGTSRRSISTGISYMANINFGAFTVGSDGAALYAGGVIDELETFNSVLTSIWNDYVNAIGIDTDGDGVPNITEVANGTDPNDPDTDSDGVPDGVDAFPLDPTRWTNYGQNQSDTTPPTIQLIEPIPAYLISPPH